jgi:hypothetical protein
MMKRVYWKNGHDYFLDTGTMIPKPPTPGIQSESPRPNDCIVYALLFRVIADIADKQLEHLVKMIIYRHRFSGFVAMPASTAEERARHLDLCRKAMQCALTIIADHVHIVCPLLHPGQELMKQSQRGMMTYCTYHISREDIS